MRKLQLTSRRVLATLMAVVLLAVLIPTVLTDKAMAADYVERDGEYYFWTEGGLRQLIADCPWGGIVHLVRDREGWRYDGTELIFTEDLTIPEEFHVKLGSADVSVAEGKTLTVEGTLELDAGNSVQGPGSLVYDNGTYIKTRDVGTLEEMNTALADAASAAESDGASGSVSITNNITADGDYTLTAGAMLQVETGYVLTVGGTLTVPAGVFTLASGRTITVQPGGQAVTIGTTLKLAGTLALEAGTETQEEGFSVFNGAVQMQPGGLLQNNGYVVLNRGIDVGSGRLHNMASGNMIIRSVLTMNHGSTLVNEGWVYIDGTACLDGTVDLSSSKDFQITGKLERGSALTLTGEEKLGYLMAVDTAAQAAEAFAQQDEVLLRMQGDMLLTEALCVPAGKTLYIGERYSNDSDTLTVTDTTLTVEDNARVLCYAGLKLIGTDMTIGQNADVTIEQPMTIGSGSTVTNDGSLTASGGLTLDGTLTVCGWTHIRGDLRASGTLDLTAENANLRIVGQLIRGEGFTLLGSESSITYISQVRNVEELGAALDSGARQVELLLTEDTVLNKAVTVPSGVTFQILQDSENVPTFTIGENGSLTVEPSQQGENYYRQTDVTALVPVVVEGTLTLRESSSANMEAGLTVTDTGRVNNNGEISVDDRHPLEVADSWDDHWTNGEDGVLFLKKELWVQDADAIVSAVAAEIDSLTVDKRFSWMNLNVRYKLTTRRR